MEDDATQRRRLSSVLTEFQQMAESQEEVLSAMKRKKGLELQLAAKTKSGRAWELMKQLDVNGERAW
eukprot:3048425-Prymnesium_polylepis.1